jgi:hypothetical protein
MSTSLNHAAQLGVGDTSKRKWTIARPVPLSSVMTHTVGIFVFNDIEVLDFAGPYEVFTTAARMHARGGRDPW